MKDKDCYIVHLVAVPDDAPAKTIISRQISDISRPEIAKMEEEARKIVCKEGML